MCMGVGLSIKAQKCNQCPPVSFDSSSSVKGRAWRLSTLFWRLVWVDLVQVANSCYECNGVVYPQSSTTQHCDSSYSSYAPCAFAEMPPKPWMLSFKPDVCITHHHHSGTMFLTGVFLSLALLLRLWWSQWGSFFPFPQEVDTDVSSLIVGRVSSF